MSSVDFKQEQQLMDIIFQHLTEKYVVFFPDIKTAEAT